MKTFLNYFGLILGLVLAVVAQATNLPPAVTGDVIIKFTDKSQAGVLLAEALRLNTNQHASLQTIARQLTADMGVPLSALRVTSGQELLMGVDRATLARALKNRLAREPSVQRVTSIETGKTLLPAAELVVRVDLRPNSAVQRQVQRDQQAIRRTSPELDMQVAELVSGISLRPVAHIDSAGRLILSLDVDGLIDDLIIRLKRRTDVVYAQPNLVARPSLKRENSPAPFEAQY